MEDTTVTSSVPEGIAPSPPPAAPPLNFSGRWRTRCGAIVDTCAIDKDAALWPFDYLGRIADSEDQTPAIPYDYLANYAGTISRKQYGAHPYDLMQRLDHRASHQEARQ